ncbi:HepT-like ribonuclease domain-containing protein [Leptolyngbya sp. AN03gr2]|uniref:HepT-like ribonuclease domain-containing protein n=1 Tax=unclassified Leptolyngbya TaxID=2650499 RepID=UPI003D317B1F
MKNSRVYLIHIRDCIDKVEAYTAEGKVAFLADAKTQDAVIRNLEIIGESTQRLPDEWKVAHPEIEWRRIVDFRNFLAHQYLDVDLDIVWNVVENYLPELKTVIELISQEFWDG